MVESRMLRFYFSKMTTMEADLSGIMAEARSVDTELNGEAGAVTGLLVLDSKGLLIGSEGEVEPGLEAVVQSIVSQAASFQAGEQPAIVINTESKKYLIKREEKITTAIIKKL